MDSSGCQCAICLESLVGQINGQSSTPIGATVPCGHCFHVACWDSWVATRVANYRLTKCPTCNQLTTSFVRLFVDFANIGNDLEEEKSLPLAPSSTPAPIPSAGFGATSSAQSGGNSMLFGSSPNAVHNNSTLGSTTRTFPSSSTQMPFGGQLLSVPQVPVPLGMGNQGASGVGFGRPMMGNSSFGQVAQGPSSSGTNSSGWLQGGSNPQQTNLFAGGRILHAQDPSPIGTNASVLIQGGSNPQQNSVFVGRSILRAQDPSPIGTNASVLVPGGSNPQQNNVYVGRSIHRAQDPSPIGTNASGLLQVGSNAQQNNVFVGRSIHRAQGPSPIGTRASGLLQVGSNAQQNNVSRGRRILRAKRP